MRSVRECRVTCAASEMSCASFCHSAAAEFLMNGVHVHERLAFQANTRFWLEEFGALKQSRLLSRILPDFHTITATALSKA